MRVSRSVASNPGRIALTATLLAVCTTLASAQAKTPPKPTYAEIKANAAMAAKPSVIAPSALIMDMESGRILWSKDPDTKRYPASTTKILTALLLLEHTEPSELISAPVDIEKITGSSLHLKPFESLNSQDMLYALMMRSANDGCEAVARHISGSTEAFAALMTERAKQIGCTNSLFANPHGLHDEAHYTTAHDLALIAREAMKKAAFRNAVRTPTYTVIRSINQEDRYIKSHNKLLDLDSSVTGIKTGWTNPAGRCFVGSIERNGLSLITVVLKSTDWVADTTRLNEWACANFESREIVVKDSEVESVPLRGGVKDKVKAVAGQSISLVLPRGAVAPELRVIADPDLHAPVKIGQSLGTLVVRMPDGTEQKSPLLAAEAIEAKPPLMAGLMGPGGMVIAGCFVLSYALLRRKSRTMVRR